MKRIVLFAALLGTVSVSGQVRFYTKKAKVSFDATTPDSPEKIRGLNESAVSVIDATSGAMQFSISMTGFVFEKALMGEHFNENYVESAKFPKAEFKGNVVNMKSVDIAKNGTYPVDVKGNLTIHGVTKEVDAKGTLSVMDGAIVAGKSEFKILLSDYKIEVPGLVADKVSKDARIKIDAAYEPVVAKK
jgi:polyisoprenoid-binding protein YceI